MYLMFDIGGTNMRLATSTDGQTLATSKTVPTPKDFNEGIQTFKKVGDELSQGQKIVLQPLRLQAKFSWQFMKASKVYI